jgi:hypothetical protein
MSLEVATYNRFSSSIGPGKLPPTLKEVNKEPSFGQPPKKPHLLMILLEPF